MLESDVVTLISNVGFPIAITLYFMFRLEKTLKEQTAALNGLALLIVKK